MVLNYDLHITFPKHFHATHEFLGKSVQLDMILIANDLFCEALHPVEKLFVGLKLVRGHILVVNLPQLCEYGSLHDLDRFFHSLPSSLIQLLNQYLILSAVHLKL